MVVTESIAFDTDGHTDILHFYFDFGHFHVLRLFGL